MGRQRYLQGRANGEGLGGYGLENCRSRLIGRRLFEAGGFRILNIESDGNVTNYYRGY